MHHVSLARRPGRRSRGFTLIEVLIAILVFSFGVLGAAAMQSLATQYATQNADRSRAAILANEAVSQMWAAQSTTVGSSVAWYTKWQSKVSTATDSGLPNGAGTVSSCGTNCATVKITWKAPAAKAAAASSAYSTSVVIQ